MKFTGTNEEKSSLGLQHKKNIQNVQQQTQNMDKDQQPLVEKNVFAANHLLRFMYIRSNK